jgi:hypothetical protein
VHRPAYYDPLDQDEIDQMIWMWSQTTVMDYAGDTTQGHPRARGFRLLRGASLCRRRRRAGGRRHGSIDRHCRADANQKIGAEMFDLVDTSIQPLANIRGRRERSADPNYLHYSKWNNFFHILDKSQCRSVDTSPPGVERREERQL